MSDTFDGLKPILLADGLMVQPIVTTGQPMVTVSGQIAPQVPSTLYPGGGSQTFYDYPAGANRGQYVQPAGPATPLPLTDNTNSATTDQIVANTTGATTSKFDTTTAESNAPSVSTSSTVSKAETNVPATSSVAQIGLKHDLAAQAGIPRTIDIVNNPASVWGANLNQLQQSFELDGATTAPIAPRASSSGNAQIFSVNDSASGVKQVQFSPDTSTLPSDSQSQHQGQYYKITMNNGSSVRVIDPNTYVMGNNGFPPNTTYVNPMGNPITYSSATKTWSLVK